MMKHQDLSLTNAALKIDQQIASRPQHPALWLPERKKIRFWNPSPEGNQHKSQCLTFSELDIMARQAAALLLRQGIIPGDRVLLAMELSYDLYAWVLAATRLGAAVLLVEPWLKLADIEKILESQRPRFFVANTMGRLWSYRVPGIGKIPHKIASQNIREQPPEDHETVLVPADSPCLIAFTSGTTGEPKGLVRSHQYLNNELMILNKHLKFDGIEGSDLVIFANFALANLANGRLSLMMPSRWSISDIMAIDALEQDLKPRSVTAGPAYMQALLDHSQLTTLRHIHIGGALTANSFFERLFVRFPDAEIIHLYGSSEVEPVAYMNAREAVQKSRERGFYHTLCLGKPLEEVELKQIAPGSLWVSGPHVSPEYLGNPAANLNNKFRDQSGKLWHRMGDRVQTIDWNIFGEKTPPTSELFYLGRDHQSLELVLNEQRLYHILNHDHAFLDPQLNESSPAEDSQKDPTTYDLYLDPHPSLGSISHNLNLDSLPLLINIIRRIIPGIRFVFLTSIVRDKRHRARIDRVKSKQKAKKYV